MEPGPLPADMSTGETPGPPSASPVDQVVRALEGQISLPGPAGAERPLGPADLIQADVRQLADQAGEMHSEIDNEMSMMAARANEMHAMIEEETNKIKGALQKAHLARAQVGSKTLSGESSVGFGVS